MTGNTENLIAAAIEDAEEIDNQVLRVEQLQKPRLLVEIVIQTKLYPRSATSWPTPVSYMTGAYPSAWPKIRY